MYLFSFRVIAKRDRQHADDAIYSDDDSSEHDIFSTLPISRADRRIIVRSFTGTGFDRTIDASNIDNTHRSAGKLQVSLQALLHEKKQASGRTQIAAGKDHLPWERGDPVR